MNSTKNLFSEKRMTFIFVFIFLSVSLIFTQNCKQTTVDPNSPVSTEPGTRAPDSSQTEKTLSIEALDSQTPIYGNPNMGWVLEYNTMEGLPYPTNHLCRDMGTQGGFYSKFDVIEIISTWGDIERQEDQRDWSRLDSAINLWISKGKKIRLRISNDDYGPYFSIPRDRLGSPEWLYSKYGVEKQIHTYDGASGWQFPNVGNPVYQQKLKNFLDAFAQRYKNKPEIEAVSILGYGAWGEWHDGYTFPNEDIKAVALRQILDIWVQSWNGSQKLLSLPIAIDCNGAAWDSPECNNRKINDYEGFKYRLAYDHALNIPLLTFNKNCVGFCTTQNEYRLLEESFYTKKLPLIGEFGGFYRDYKNQSAGRSMQGAKDDIFKQRLNYITSLGWSCDLHDADNFYTEQQGFIDSVMLQLGYRLSLTKITLPEVLRRGANFNLRHFWKNEGVGRFYGDYDLKVYLLNQNQEIVWEGVEKQLNLDDCLKGQPDVERISTFSLPITITPGTYQLKLAIVDPNTGIPKIKLAIKGRDQVGRYLMGSVIVQEQSDTYSYAWQISDYSSCSATCGGGSQSRSVLCKRNDGQIVADSMCSSPKPASSQSCNTQTCNNTTVSYSWNLTSFGTCSVSCGGGTQTRTVTCKSSSGQIVADSMCSSPKPAVYQSCNTQICSTTVSYSWNLTSFGTCSASCGGGTQTRTVTCKSSSGQIVAESMCTSPKPASSQSCNTQTCTTTTKTNSIPFLIINAYLLN